MLDPEGRPADPPGEPEHATEPVPGTEALTDLPLADSPPAATAPASSDWPAIGYWAAIGARAGSGAPAGVAPGVTPAAGWSPEPPPPTWTRTYDPPTARGIVSSGLQLAVASSRAIRRASIYIGLLALGAFGPLVILLLLGIGRLMSNPDTTGTFAGDPTLLFFEQPALAELLGFVYVLLILGGLLLVAISIDAQAIAIALLAGTASDRPLRLREAVARARQTFWRLLGTGLLVGLASGLIALAITIPFIRPLETNEGLTFIASMLGTLAVVPFAFASTGIVLGDVGGMEALRRSVALFKARPPIALVVVLFTLVTSAIETFALGAGADVAIRVGEFLHLGLDQGAAGLILPTVLVLAFIVAFGSLTFTIAAIVAAPQVTGFLGLTFFSGGLDLARNVDGVGSRARWVTIPMLASMVILVIVGAAGLQAVYAFEPRAASPALAFLRTSAEAHDWLVSASGEPLVVEDPAGDQGPGGPAAVDILAADMTGLYFIPEWLVQDVFMCGKAGVACDEGTGAETAQLDSGGYLFVQRMAAPLPAAGGGHREWGPMVRVYGPGAATDARGRYAGANYRFSTEVEGEELRMRAYRYGTAGWREFGTTARSAWRGDLLVTFVPVNDLPSEPTAWDAYASIRSVTASGDDNIRAADGKVLEIEGMPWIDFLSNDFFGPGFSFDPDLSFPPDFPFEP